MILLSSGVDYMYNSEAEMRPQLFKHEFNAVRPSQMWLLKALQAMPAHLAMSQFRIDCHNVGIT